MVIFIFILLLLGLFIYVTFFSKKETKISSYPQTIPIGSNAVYDNNMRVFLAGVHVATRKNYILKNGWDTMPVDLVAEPTNKFDKNAIAVKHEEKIIGYIPSDKTDVVHPILLKDHTARFDSMDEEDSYSNPGQTHLKVYLRIDYND